MLLRLVLLLTAVPIVELVVLLRVHHWLVATWGTGVGLAITIGTILLTGVIGAWLARTQGLGIVRSIGRCLEKGESPGQALLEGALVLVGGAMLLTPGFVTDAVGLSLLVPASRGFYCRCLRRWFERKIAKGAFRVQAHGFRPPPHGFEGIGNDFPGGATGRPVNNDEVIDVTTSGEESECRPD